MKFTKTFDVVYYTERDEQYRPCVRRESHRYTETWGLTEWHCPKCAAREVWQDQSSGDYYAGAALICSACGHSFHMPEYGRFEEQEKQRLDSLRR